MIILIMIMIMIFMIIIMITIIISISIQITRGPRVRLVRAPCQCNCLSIVTGMRALDCQCNYVKVRIERVFILSEIVGAAKNELKYACFTRRVVDIR